jgi:hypothetical protein
MSTSPEKETWKFAGSCQDGNKFILAGIDVWQYKWQRIPDEKAQVKDPVYGQAFGFPIYQIHTNGKTIKFSAGEFSNCIWGFYIPLDVKYQNDLLSLPKTY